MSSSFVRRLLAERLQVRAVEHHVEVARPAGVADVVVALDLRPLGVVDRVLDGQRVEAEHVVEQGDLLVGRLEHVEPERRTSGRAGPRTASAPRTRAVTVPSPWRM